MIVVGHLRGYFYYVACFFFSFFSYFSTGFSYSASISFFPHFFFLYHCLFRRVGGRKKGGGGAPPRALEIISAPNGIRFSI